MKLLTTSGFAGGGVLLGSLTSSVWPCICLGILVVVFLGWVIVDDKRPERLAMALRGTPESHCNTESNLSPPPHPPDDAPLSS
uniref:Uncharacterized protein n=1 Tax=uncultured prokaryote TaxID=198431 RepID=A0A0H5QJ43_9ZZZZ|nr:hypothetical protein [uncultured prokaryote]